MPVPPKNFVIKKVASGPKPKCECMKCKTCLARIRQRRFYEKNSLRLKLGTDILESNPDAI